MHFPLDTIGVSGLFDNEQTAVFECQKFLNHEAWLLDTTQYNEWFSLLAEDLDYRVPVRITRERAAGLGYSDTAFHFLDNWPSIKARIARLNTDFAFSEDPPSRTRRFVSNVAVGDIKKVNGNTTEIEVRNYLLLYRGQGETWDYDIISGMRHDLLRVTDGNWSIARRHVFLDQTALGTKNLAIFL